MAETRNDEIGRHCDANGNLFAQAGDTCDACGQAAGWTSDRCENCGAVHEEAII